MKKVYKVLGLAVSAFILALSFYVLTHAQELSDWWVLRSYQPSAQVSALADNASFTDEGRNLFYVYDPQLLDKQNFRGKCTIGEETIVLGCYISNDKIYIFDVNDPRLNGIEEVTSAHEMLHAVYNRLSGSEKSDLDKTLLDHFERLDDERLNKTIENYRARDPSIVANELHSIFGTEYDNLPSELEEHYRRYFIDRTIVVNLSKAYYDEFERRENQIKDYDARLQVLNAEISEQQTNLEMQNSALQTEYANMMSLRESDPDSYNRTVPGYNQNVNRFNRELVTLKAKIDEYNRLVEERNAIAFEEQSLIESIDTRLQSL